VQEIFTHCQQDGCNNEVSGIRKKYCCDRCRKSRNLQVFRDKRRYFSSIQYLRLVESRKRMQENSSPAAYNEAMKLIK